MSSILNSREKLCLSFGFGFGALVSSFYWLYKFDHLVGHTEITAKLRDPLKLNLNKVDGSYEEITVPKDKHVTLFI